MLKSCRVVYNESESISVFEDYIYCNEIVSVLELYIFFLLFMYSYWSLNFKNKCLLEFFFYFVKINFFDENKFRDKGFFLFKV